MEQKARSFYKINNQEQGRDKQISDWFGPQSTLFEERGPRAGLPFENWPTEYTVCLVRQSIDRDMKVIQVSVC